MFSAIYGRLLKQNQPLIYSHEFEDFSSSIVFGPSIDSPGIDSPSIDSPIIDSPAINGPAIISPEIDSPPINNPIINNQPINPQEIDALAPAIQGGIGNTTASE
jgi:hypothetical protein